MIDIICLIKDDNTIGGKWFSLSLETTRVTRNAKLTACITAVTLTHCVIINN